MDLWGYSLDHAGYLERLRQPGNTEATKRPTSFAQVSIRVQDVNDLRRIAAFIAAAADNLEAEGGHGFVEFRHWDDNWLPGTENLIVGC